MRLFTEQDMKEIFGVSNTYSKREILKLLKDYRDYWIAVALILAISSYVFKGLWVYSALTLVTSALLELHVRAQRDKIKRAQKYYQAFRQMII